MTEADIRGNGLTLLGVLGDQIAADLPPAEREMARMVVKAAGDLVVQALVDLNRIAAALEHVALNGMPRQL